MCADAMSRVMLETLDAVDRSGVFHSVERGWVTFDGDELPTRALQSLRGLEERRLAVRVKVGQITCFFPTPEARGMFDRYVSTTKQAAATPPRGRRSRANPDASEPRVGTDEDGHRYYGFRGSKVSILTESMVMDIRKRYLTETARSIAESLGLKWITVYAAVKGRSFADLPGAVTEPVIRPRGHVVTKATAMLIHRAADAGHTAAQIGDEVGIPSWKVGLVRQGKLHPELLESLYPDGVPKWKKADPPPLDLTGIDGLSRAGQMLTLRERGARLEQIGQHFGVTRERVRQLVKREEDRIAIQEARDEREARERAVREKRIRDALTAPAAVPINTDLHQISHLDLSVRSYNCLMKERLNTIGKVRAASDRDLLEIRGFGVACLRELRDSITAYDARMAEVSDGS